MIASLLRSIDTEVETYAKLGLISGNVPDLIPKWQELTSREPRRFLNNDHSIKVEALENFRRLQIFISDAPAWNTNKLTLRSVLDGGRRGEKKMLLECLAVLKEHQYDDLLRKYPCHQAGNPYVFEHEGFRYTLRWFKHIYFLGLMKKILSGRLDKSFVGLDIGSSYGIFSSLLKREHPESHHVLVDFPEQLILAYYFLSACFPEARIAGINEVSHEENISRRFIEKHDFVLVPSSIYQRMASNSSDLVTNFASFGEMKREWLDFYLKSPPFTSAKYFFTANRVQSYPTYDTDLTILDYPIWNPQKKLHFASCPAFFGYYWYKRRNLFFHDRQAFPPYFEYIGEI